MPIAVGNPGPWRHGPVADLETLVALGRETAPPTPSPDPPIRSPHPTGRPPA